MSMNFLNKVIILVAVLTLPAIGFAQTVTTDPEEFSAVEPITIRVNVTGTPLDDIDETEDLFIWIFKEGCCGSPTNGDWENSSDTKRMTKVGENTWEFTITSIRDVLEQSPGTIGDEFGFLVKARSGADRGDGVGGRQTDNINLPVLPPRFVATTFRTFPANFSQGDVVTVFYDQNLDENEETNKLAQIFLYATANLKDNSSGRDFIEPVSPAEVGNTESLALKNLGDGKFSLTMIPSKFFGLADGEEIDNITFRLRSKDDENITIGDRSRQPFTLK